MGRKKKITTSMNTDLISGARAYNRLDLQLSQAVLLTIELFPQPNFLVLMDYYDDIVVFDDKNKNANVTFYQVKTKDNDSMSMDTILGKDWLPKLYSHMRNPEFVVKELAFVTNAPITYKLNDGNRKKLENPKTVLSTIENETQNKIKEKIANVHGITVDEVDLTKFCHIKTTLTIEEHKCIAKQKFTEFLFENVGEHIDGKSINTIFASLIAILTNKQSTELQEETDFCEIIKHKGFTKDNLQRIINETLIISLPPFEKIWAIIGGTEEEKREYSIGYSKLLSFQMQSQLVYRAIIDEIQEIYSTLEGSNFHEKLMDCLTKLSKTPKYAFAHIADKYPDILLASIEMKKEEETE